jgi:hypothetical protein
VDQKGSDVSIASFGDAEETRSPTAGLMAWHKTKPSRELAAISERGSIAGRRDKRGGGQLGNPAKNASTFPRRSFRRSTTRPSPSAP